ncbi:type II toxin-antitoxin system VapC family toxin [Planomonospora sp. ID82291]|uniref:type II toxin-antitoxin system VapC family toxin n=1 Tax=Planomonospora sp. ID82291 TaxID=2738136 RepID=UPI0018C3E138|nr:type II toxin-antitoxin system VapC family toxin [Planomonospora sp. ID82291]MBG0814488.1 type II toxin-antitoxin system VapC family toxin [Planomonospora sp. ID82291]
MADAYVVDTGVFLRWFVDQPGFEHAREVQGAFLNGLVKLETADFARIEVAGVLRKKGLLTGRLTAEEFAAAVRVIDDLGVAVHQIGADHLERAAGLAVRLTLRMYDAVFAQLAFDRGVPLLTTDAKLCHAVEGVVKTEILRGVEQT